MTTQALDYSLYPDYPHSIGFSQRDAGCGVRSAWFPTRRGASRKSALLQRSGGDPYPRNVLLLDNDFFGAPQWRARVEELREGRFRVCFSQGINARLLDEEAASALASLRYYDGEFRRRRIYTAWDNRKDETGYSPG